MPEVNRRQFFGQLFGAVAPTVAVAVYPAATLGVLERLFWKPLKSYFHFQEDPEKVYLDSLNKLFMKVYAEKLQCAIPEIHFWVTQVDPVKREITIEGGELCDHLEVYDRSVRVNAFVKSPFLEIG
jgi:hypothetical protein